MRPQLAAGSNKKVPVSVRQVIIYRDFCLYMFGIVVSFKIILFCQSQTAVQYCFKSLVSCSFLHLVAELDIFTFQITEKWFSYY
jgi:hypothetical protein